MRIIFVSVLLSTAVGNSSHAMEVSVDEDEDSTTSVEKKLFNINQKKEKEVLKADKLIKSLADMKKLAIQIIGSQRNLSETRNDFPQESEIEIPDFVTIDPQVFIEYASNENIMEEFEPVLLERILFCKSNRKNQFEYVRNKTPNRYENWAKKMIFVFYYEQDNPIEVITRNRLQQFEDTNESENIEDLLKEQLRKEKWKNEKLVKKTELNQTLRNFLEKQQAHKNNINEWKKLGLFLLVEAACFVGGMYSIC